MEHFSLRRTIITNKSFEIREYIWFHLCDCFSSIIQEKEWIEDGQREKWKKNRIIMLNLTHVDDVHYELNTEANTDTEQTKQE